MAMAAAANGLLQRTCCTLAVSRPGKRLPKARRWNPICLQERVSRFVEVMRTSDCSLLASFEALHGTLVVIWTPKDGSSAPEMWLWVPNPRSFPRLRHAACATSWIPVCCDASAGRQ
ncbi:hypothetical protein JX266_010591 [Neoarthrinium moseri]|nr:hypothetical protein JX266_010591 [Neoarthrinium moseri]